MPAAKRVVAVALSIALPLAPAIAAPPDRDETVEAMRRATAFYYGEVARHGGYVYAYSADLSLSEGEGTTDKDTIWVQPPGTPLVGEAFLDAYEATGEKIHLDAAIAAGRALVLGQLQSGGWFYSAKFSPSGREELTYRRALDGSLLPNKVSSKDRTARVGWHDWKRRKYKGNLTTLDDDVTQAATRFLVRLDKTLKFKNELVHEAAQVALTSLLHSQYPNGAWSANYDRLQDGPPLAKDYPVMPASYPESWPRTWPKDFAGCYVTNDDLIADAIDTMLRAYAVYGDERYLESAKRAGDFLLLAQMPDPQPAWAQQYDKQMHPSWSRAFEPSAISGLESQNIIAALMRLSAATDDPKYLEPIPRAIAYLRKSRRPDGRLARFYGLRTNRPLYFTRGKDGRHVMTYDDDRLATGYGYVVDSRLDELGDAYVRLKKGRPMVEPRSVTELAAAAQQIIDNQDDRGAWVEPGRLRHHKIEPPGGVINSATFAENVTTLCEYLNATR